MNRLKKMLPYLIIMLINFYGLPLLISDTGSGMLVLLGGIPLICFTISLVYGFKNAINLSYAIIVALFFLPSILLFYNETAYVYAVIYGLLALFGEAIGAVFYKKYNLK